MSDMIPERNQVDGLLNAARDRIGSQDRRNAVLNEPNGNAILLLAETLLDVGAALVHQVRDADDTVATVLAPNIEQGLADLIVAADGNASALSSAISALGGEKKSRW